MSGDDYFDAREAAERNEMAFDEINDEIESLRSIGKEMYDAMAEFVHRCEIGEVRARKTHAKFKEIISRAKEIL